MEIRWSERASGDFAGIIQYIRRENPDAALRMARTIYQQLEHLKKFLNSGRSGRVDGTRELTLPPLPFLVAYRVKQNVVEIACCTVRNAGRNESHD